MKKTFFALFLILLSLGSYSQPVVCEPDMTCRIIAPSGMRMRSQPSLKAKVVTYVPYDSLLTACLEPFGAMTYEEINGNWRKVFYKDFEGYMFDGFLEIVSIDKTSETQDLRSETSETQETRLEDKETSEKRLETVETKPQTAKKPSAPAARTTKASQFSFVTEAYNYCGDIRDIDPGLLWYGIYPEDPESGNGHYRIKQVEMKVIKSKYAVGKGLEFDITTDSEERSIFLFGVNKPLDLEKISVEDQSQRFRYSGRKVYPGQEIELVKGKKPVKLSATGNVQSSGPCPDLQDYKLSLSGEKYFLPVEQNLTREIVYAGQCGMPEIYWYGDLTGDGIPEMIFVSVYEERNHFSLFVSDPTKDNFLIKKQAEWIIDKCY